MAWEKRGDELYYYQSERVDGRVQKRYVGRGDLAETVAHADETRRAVREQRRREARGHVEWTREVSKIGKDLDAVAEILATAEMVAAGYHNHKGEWRRRREC